MLTSYQNVAMVPGAQASRIRQCTVCSDLHGCETRNINSLFTKSSGQRTAGVLVRQLIDGRCIIRSSTNIEEAEISQLRPWVCARVVVFRFSFFPIHDCFSPIQDRVDGVDSNFENFVRLEGRTTQGEEVDLEAKSRGFWWLDLLCGGVPREVG